MKFKRGLFLLTLYIALLGGSFMLYSLVLPIRVSFHVVASLGLVAYLYKKGLPDSPLTIGAMLMTVAAIVSIPQALDPRMASENVWSYVVNLLLLLVMVQLCRDGYAPTLFKAHFAAGAFIALFALGQFALTRVRPGGWFDNITLTGAYAAALLIPALNTGRECRGWQRWSFYGLSVLLLLTVLITDSRGGMLSAGVALVTYILLASDVRRLYKTLLVCAAALGLVAALTFLSMRANHATGDSVRIDLWRSAGDMIQTYPTGVGAGLFAQAYRQIGASGENRFTGAHNHYLTLGAELGAVGLATGAILFLFALYGLVGLPLSRSQKAALAALCGIGAQLLFDNYPSVNWALLVGLYVAFLLQDARFMPVGRSLQLLSASVALLLVVWTIRMFQYDHAQELYESALHTGRYYDAYSASALDPENRLYRLEMEKLSGKQILFSPMDALTMYGRVYR